MKDEEAFAGGEHAPSSKAASERRSELPRRSESDFINTVRKRALSVKQSSDSDTPSSFILHPSSLLTGIGDDAAVIRQAAGRNTVITTDLLVEDIDFERQTLRPRLLGHKALAVSLSDIAAMGARPRWSLLSIGLPADIWDSDFVDQFYEGFFSLAKRYDVQLVGGDVSRTPEKIVIDSIVLGECAPEREILRRGARSGDQLFVTGALGGSAAGLRLLERGARVAVADDVDADADSLEQLLLRHLRPEPRVGWGLVLGEERLASAMIDISDGLSSDLNHLCRESAAGALVDAARIPIDSLVTALCGRRALDPLSLALHGGEDFELLFSVPPDKVTALPKSVDGVSISRIGEITNEPGRICIIEKDRIWDLEPKGFDHFRHIS
jgi:thiamine-monophosphate kinase